MSFHHNTGNLVALKLVSKLALIPFDFVPKTGKIRKWASLWKWIVWHFLGASFVLCTIYLWVQFGRQVCRPPADLNLAHLSVHFIFSLLNAFTVYLLFEYRRHSNDIVIIWNGAMGNVESADDDGRSRRSTGTPFDLRNCTLQEALIHYLPELWAGLILVVVPFILSDPTRPQLFYHVVGGATLKGVGVGGYVLFGCLEFCMTIFMSSTTFIYAYIQLVFLQNCSLMLKNEARKLKLAAAGSTGKENIRKALRRCREIEILICLFNQSNSKVIFATKIMLLSISMSGLFFGIKFHDQQPLIAAFNGLFGLTYTVFYTVIYEKAFQIPELVKEMKRVILVSLLLSQSQNKQKEQKKLRWGKRLIPQPQPQGQLDSFVPEMSREVASISNIGIITSRRLSHDGKNVHANFH